jgi:para-nitrobenzyl esterase
MSGAHLEGKPTAARSVCTLAIVVLLLDALAGCAAGEKAAPLAVDPLSRRTVRSGEIVGFVGQYGSHVWLGIPFAQSPVGDLRWRAPQPAGSWPGVREATSFGSHCVQLPSRFAGVAEGEAGVPTGTEDCLYLNVYAPRFAPEEVPSGEGRLPVMMWIHGGGNSIGLAALYDGGKLAAARDVIVVTVNYRLGPLGWFRHAALRSGADNQEDRSGNFGTLDQIAALEWIRDNIAAFGGDPGNVTIFGESAGARDVISLLVSPRAAGLFHRAIAQSGSSYNESVEAAENFSDDAAPGHRGSSNELLAALLIADRTASDRAAAKKYIAATPADEIARYLRRKSAGDLLLAYGTEQVEGLIDFPNVFADGVVLREEEPLDCFANGEYSRVPVILGTNRDEQKLFMFPNPRWVQRILWVIPRLRDERLYNATAAALSDMWKVRGADAPARAMREAQGPTVYVYRWDWDEQPSMLGAELSVMLGAAHGFEIPFVFEHFDLGAEANRMFTSENEAGRIELARKMSSYWTQFARTGNPGRGRDGDLPEWKAWDPSKAEAPKFIVLDTETDGGIRMSSESLTVESVVARIEADPRLETASERCGVYRELAVDGRGFTATDYAERESCRDYPLQEVALGGS